MLAVLLTFDICLKFRVLIMPTWIVHIKELICKVFSFFFFLFFQEGLESLAAAYSGPVESVKDSVKSSRRRRVISESNRLTACPRPWT